MECLATHAGILNIRCAQEPSVGSLSADLGGLVKKRTTPASSLAKARKERGKEPRSIGGLSVSLSSLVKKKGAPTPKAASKGPSAAQAAVKKPASPPGLGLVGNYSDSSESN